MTRTIGLLSAVALLVLTQTAHAEPKVVALNVYPPDIHLNTKADLQRYIVVATRDDGVTLDVTSQAAIKLTNPAPCKMEQNALYPVVDGATTLEA